MSVSVKVAPGNKVTTPQYNTPYNTQYNTILCRPDFGLFGGTSEM